MMGRASLRLAATLLVAGEVFSLLVGIFHPARENPNDHRVVFAEYAESTHWAAIHLGQFIGMAAVIAGLVVLFYALKRPAGMLGWSNRFGVVSAGVTLALYAVLQAVDGVALKQAVDAWASAPDVEKAARFASAEAIRWLEWGVRSYQSFMLGLTLALLAMAFVSTARTLRPVGYLVALSGVAYIIQGFVLGSEGFSATNTIPQLLAYVLMFAWSIWLLVVAWRMEKIPDVLSDTV